MSAIPGSVPTWATATNYPAGLEPEAGTPTKVALSMSQATIGWRPGKKPPAQEFNYHANLVGQWLQYFKDGVFDASHSFTFNALLTLAAGLTLSANQHVTVSGTGQYKHGLRTRVIPAIGGVSSSIYGTITGSTIARTGASGGTYYRQIEFDAGKRILEIRIRLKDGSGPTTVTAQLVRDVDGVQTNVQTIGTSAGTGAYQTISATGINHTVTISGQYAIAFTFGGSAANVDLNRIEIDYDNP